MQNYGKIWHHCGDGLVLVAAETGSVVDANHKAEKLLGRRLDELKRLPFTGLYPADESEGAAKALSGWLEGSEAAVGLTLLRPDGTRLPVSVSASVFEEEGRPVVVCSLRDDSARRNAETAALRLNWALSAIRRANLAAACADSEADLMRSVCEGILGDIFVLAWVGIAIDDPDRTVAVAAVGGRTAYLDNLPVSWADAPNGMGPTGRAIRLCQSQINNFAQSNPDFSPWADRARLHGIESSMSTPLIRDGKAFGALTIYSNHKDAFCPEEVKVFDDLARDLVFGLDARRALAALREREQSWRSLFDNMLGGFAHCLMHYENGVATDFTYLDVNPAFHRLTGLGDVVGKRIGEIIPGLRESNPDVFEIYGRVAQTGVPERFETHVSALDIWFSISVYSTAKHQFVAVFDNVTERRKAEERALFLAHHDVLTGLPNRLVVRDKFNQAIEVSARNATRTALVFLDVDNFKTINDTLGHSAGDALLEQVAARISECIRTTDTVSRQGGDESRITAAIAKILDHLAEPFTVEGRELASSASVGVAIYPDDGEDFDTLLRKADTAMYHAKEEGRNACRFFDRQMNADAEEHLALRNELRLALERDEFILHYQPQIDLANGRVVGAEALIRWQHPKLGLIPPGKFIPIAEESGLIMPIGEGVLHEACRQAAAWQKTDLPELVVAVNLSAVQFRRGHLEKTVVAALMSSGLAPGFLELELTESILIGDTETILQTVRRLKMVGVALSIDDFGTGYSSLAYLKRFAVDKLKIDQSFVRSLETGSGDEAIVRAIIQMAHSLGLRTIAEGVEEERVLDLLRTSRCDEAQGYHIARPMPADAFKAFMETHR